MGQVLWQLSGKAYGAVSGLRNAALAMFVLTGAVFAEPVTIAALGDSLTAGYGLENQADGLVPQLESWLKDQGAEVVIQNAGVSGDTSAGGLARMDWTLGPEVQGLIVTLGGNDMLRGLDPAGTRASLEGILQKAQERGVPVLLVGMQAPGNFGPDFKTSFDAMYPELAATYSTLLADSFFDGLVAAGAEADNPASFAPFMQPDGIHPNPDGVKRIVEGLGPKVLELLALAKG